MDLLIRTSGEMRLSNFLLWQCAYAEFMFPDVALAGLYRGQDFHACINAYGVTRAPLRRQPLAGSKPDAGKTPDAGSPL